MLWMGGALTGAGVWGQGSEGGWQEGIIAAMATGVWGLLAGAWRWCEGGGGGRGREESPCTRGKGVQRGTAGSQGWQCDQAGHGGRGGHPLAAAGARPCPAVPVPLTLARLLQALQRQDTEVYACMQSEAGSPPARRTFLSQVSRGSQPGSPELRLTPQV